MVPIRHQGIIDYLRKNSNNKRNHRKRALEEMENAEGKYEIKISSETRKGGYPPTRTRTKKRSIPRVNSK